MGRTPVRVTRTKAEARASYDRMSGRYEAFGGRFERPYRDAGVALLAPAPGETVLELGYGPGEVVVALGRAVGPEGRVLGVDLSEGMHAVASRRVADAGLADRVELTVGDAAALPHPDRSVDAAFMAFTLELFDTPEIPVVLAECARVLRPAGRLGVVAMALPERPGVMERLYTWSHRRFPSVVDCRPIPTVQFLGDAGFVVRRRERRTMWGLAVDLVVAAAPTP